MGIFSDNYSGGFMDEIRCDEPSYLIWKWHPRGTRHESSHRENAIRWGSPLRVKDGEAAVFVYKQKNGTMQDFIEGPFDKKIETANFPVLASIVGLAYGGGTPFQAEIYFINLARVIQIPFAVPFFDIFDSKYTDIAVPAAVRGKITFNIADYKDFIKMHRLINFDLNVFKEEIKDAVTRYVKGVVANVSIEMNISVMQIERVIPRINDRVESAIKERLRINFGINVTNVDISAVEPDKSSDGYMRLKTITQDIAMATMKAQLEANLKNISDMQRIKAENVEETLRIQREESQYAKHKKTQSENMTTYQLEKQAEVGVAGANAIGKMGMNGAAEISGSGSMNMAGIVTGMTVGGAVGKNMADVINNVMGSDKAQQSGVTPPVIPAAGYYIALNGQASGPCDIILLNQLTTLGFITKDSLVWKHGMTQWAAAETIPELSVLFNNSASCKINEMPPIPPTL